MTNYIVSKMVFDKFGNIRMELANSEAIPIEWIVSWLKKDDKHYCSVDLMLEDWEKENETDR